MGFLVGPGWSRPSPFLLAGRSGFARRAVAPLARFLSATRFHRICEPGRCCRTRWGPAPCPRLARRNLSTVTRPGRAASSGMRGWAMFYTGSRRSENGLIQRIGMATSPDLMHWTKDPANPLIEADPAWYELLDLDAWHDQAWRDPWVFQHPATGEFHALITARVRSGPPHGRGVYRTCHVQRLAPLDGPAAFDASRSLRPHGSAAVGTHWPALVPAVFRPWGALCGQLQGPAWDPCP